MTEQADRASGLDEWRAGWFVVVASAFGVGVSQLHYLSLGFMMGPIERETGWTRGDISVATLIFSILLAFVSPVAGRLIDRSGERPIGVPAIAAYCALLALLSQAGPGVGGWWAIWAAIACVSPFASILFWTTVVARRFARQRGLALAVTLSGSGVGMALMPAISHVLIDAYGWRHAYLLLGIVGALVVVPLAWFALDGAPPVAAAGRAAKRDKLPWIEALRSPAFVRLTFAGTVMSMMSATVAVHLVPLQLQRGIPAETAAAAMGLVGVGAVTGRFVVGVLLDRSRGPRIGAWTYALPVLPCALLLGAPPLPALALAIGLLFGLCSGSETDVLSYFTARYFGAGRYGAMFGACFGIVGAMAGVGPWLAGLIFDRAGGYTPVVAALVPLALLAALALGTLGPYPARKEG